MIPCTLNATVVRRKHKLTFEHSDIVVYEKGMKLAIGQLTVACVLTEIVFTAKICLTGVLLGVGG